MYSVQPFGQINRKYAGFWQNSNLNFIPEFPIYFKTYLHPISVKSQIKKQYFTATKIHCRCQNIRLVFRVLRIHNSEEKLENGPFW